VSAALTRLQRLRDLHRELDQTVLTAYGWQTESDFGPALALRHDFHPLDFLPENDRIRLTLHPEARREMLTRLLKLNHQRAAQAEQVEKQAALTAPKKKSKPKQTTVAAPPELNLGLDVFGRAAVQTPTETPPRNRMSPSVTGERINTSKFKETVVRFDFAVPSRPRPRINSTAELYTILLPALVQEAGGQIEYQELLEAMSFLADPPKAAAVLPPNAAAGFAVWRANFPSGLVDPKALHAALHDLIVMRQALNIISDGSSFVIFKGINWADITLDWVLLDAKMALGYAANSQTAAPPWENAVAERDLKLWAVA